MGKGELGLKYIDGEWLTEEGCYRKNYRLIPYGVNKALKGMRPQECEYEDLLSIGTEAFIKAFRRYSKERGTKFSTYAVSLIWGEVMTYLGRHYSLVRKPRRVSDIIGKLKDDIRDMTVKEVAEKHGLTIKEVEDVRINLMMYASMDSTVQEDIDGERSDLHQFIGDTEDITVLYVREFKRSLGKRQQKVLELVLRGESQSRIAREIGVSQPQISRELVKIRKEYLDWFGEGQLREGTKVV